MAWEQRFACLPTAIVAASAAAEFFDFEFEDFEAVAV
jgi:hypothetical protein